MSKVKLRADFFCFPNGAILKRARPIDYHTREKVFKRDNFTCTICGDNVVYFKPLIYCFSDRVGNVHHVVSISRGGQNDLSNLKLCCEGCHSSQEVKL